MSIAYKDVVLHDTLKTYSYLNLTLFKNCCAFCKPVIAFVRCWDCFSVFNAVVARSFCVCNVLIVALPGVKGLSGATAAIGAIGCIGFIVICDLIVG